MTSRPVSEAFLLRHTTVVRPPLVPEIALRVAADVVALWEAIETDGGTVGLDPPFWAAAWPGGQVLARHLLDRPDTVLGRRVLDLGSGSGLVAVAAALAGAREVVASDVDPYSLAAIGVNAALNGVSGIHVVGDVLDTTPDGFDVVLAGDVCYDRTMTGRVLPFLRAARAHGAEVLLGDPGRAYLPVDGLQPVAAYDVPDVDTDVGSGAAVVRRGTVWSLD